MARGYLPVFTSWCGDPKLKLIMDERLPHFFQDHQRELGALAVNSWLGAEAFEKKLKDVRGAIAANTKVELEEVRFLSVYEWLMTKERNVEATAIVEKAFKEAAFVPNCAPALPATKTKSSSALAGTPSAATSSSALASADNVLNLCILSPRIIQRPGRNGLIDTSAVAAHYGVEGCHQQCRFHIGYFIGDRCNNSAR